MKKTIIACLIVLLAVNTCILALVAMALHNDSKISKIQLSENASEVVDTEDCSCRIRFEERQLFFGDWRIVELVAPDYSLPTSYSGIDNDGFVKGSDWTAVCGKVLKITHEYIETEGMLYKYDTHHTPKVYVLPVDENHNSEVTNKNIIFYYKDETLGFDGEFVPVMDFVLEGNFHVTDKRNYPPEQDFSVRDFDKMYLLDKNTAYLSDGVLMFLMKRTEK